MNSDNVNLERQLDDVGRKTAAAMGRALRDLEGPGRRRVHEPHLQGSGNHSFRRSWSNPKPVPELLGG